MTLGSGRRGAIESTLVDYHHSPGKYPLIRKQPPLLFSSIKEVLQLASGRSPDGDGAAGPSPVVQQAACFFVRSALLYPDADHYALFGLDHSANAAAVKDRYRLMMRLMHPDFSSSVVGAHWPADAASRVNQAYEVLSSTVLRRRYDDKLDPPAIRRPVTPEVRTASIKVAAGKAQAQDPQRRLRKLAAVFGGIGGVALLAGLFAAVSADKESLVQRPPTMGDPIAVAPPIATTTWHQPPPPDRQETAPQIAAAVVAKPTPPLASPPAAAAAAAVRPIRAQTPPEQAALYAPVLMRQVLRQEVPPPTSTAVRVTTTSAPAPAAVPPVFQVTAQASPAPAPVMTLVPAPAPSLPPAPVLPVAKAPPQPGVTLAEAHPLLSKLLQQMESGWGDRVVGMLDREARAAPAAQALLQHYNSLVDGMRPVKLSRIQFKSQPREGRLLVTGHVLMQVRDQPPGAPAKELALEAEFQQRNGTVVMTSLARAQE